METLAAVYDRVAPALSAILAAALISVIGAIALRGAVQWMQKVEVSFGRAYLTIFLAAIGAFFFGGVVTFAVGGNTNLLHSILVVIVGLLMLSVLVRVRIWIPFARACVVALVTFAIGALIGLLITGPLFLINLMESHG